MTTSLEMGLNAEEIRNIAIFMRHLKVSSEGTELITDDNRISVTYDCPEKLKKIENNILTLRGLLAILGVSPTNINVIYGIGEVVMTGGLLRRADYNNTSRLQIRLD